MSQSANVTRPADPDHEAPPPFDPDLDLIAHLEGNAHSLRGYRRKAEELRERPDESTGRSA
jgi:predicted secreted protein